MANDTKPGFRTTEFWLTTATLVVGTLLTSGAIVEGSSIASVLGFVSVTLATLGYQFSRAIVKKSG